jgi:pimeloyl-ACP methyl ester carboxylesterase
MVIQLRTEASTYSKNEYPEPRADLIQLLKEGGHFLQEDCAEEFAEVIVDFITQT